RLIAIRCGRGTTGRRDVEDQLTSQSRGDHLRSRRSRSDRACNGRRQWIGHVADRKDILDAGLLARIDYHVSGIIQLQLTAHEIRVWFEPNTNHHTLHGHLKRIDGSRAFDLNRLDAVVAENTPYV